MFRSIAVGHHSCLDSHDKKRIWRRPCVAVLLAVALVAGIPSSPTLATDLDWLEEQTKKLLDDIYEGTKEAVTGESAQPPEEDDPAPEVQVQDTPAATPNPPKIEQSTPQVQVADTPRFDKPWVTEIQTHLTTLGYSPGVIDGAFGNKSQTAITAFQQQRGDPLTGLPTPSVMAALRGESEAATQAAAQAKPQAAPQAAPQATAPATPQAATNVSAAAPSPVSPIYEADDINRLATFAGKYAAWADVCGDPASAEVRSDFLARAELLAPNEQAAIVPLFDKRYAKKKKNADLSLESCILKGKTDCCTVGPEVAKPFAFAKKRYQSYVAKLDAATAPAESAESATDSATAAPAISEQPSSVAASPAENSGSSGESAAASPAPAPAPDSVESPQLAAAENRTAQISTLTVDDFDGIEWDRHKAWDDRFVEIDLHFEHCLGFREPISVRPGTL